MSTQTALTPAQAADALFSRVAALVRETGCPIPEAVETALAEEIALCEEILSATSERARVVRAHMAREVWTDARK